MSRIYACLLIAVFCSFACSKKERSAQDKIAIVNDEVITLSELDESVKHQLHERLYDIYKIREIALAQIIESKLLALESRAKGINVDSLLVIEVDSKVNEENLSKFVTNNALQDGIAPPDNPFKLISLDSEYGQQLLVDTYKEYLKDELINRLKATYKVSTSLQRPTAPPIDLEVVKYPIIAGDDNAIELNYIADLDCEFSRKNYPVVMKVVKEYDGQLNFNYVPYNSGITYATLVASMANEAGKFSELMGLVCEKMPGDSSGYNNILKLMGIPSKQASDHYNKHVASLRETFVKLKHEQIKVTPTLVIDGRPYYGMITYDHLKGHLAHVLKRRNEAPTN